MAKTGGFLDELKRRNVFRMAGLYLVGAWLATQVASTLLPVFDAPAWAMKAVVGVLAIGLIPALIVAWVFELTPDGLKRDEDVPESQSIAPQTARRMDRMIIVVLALALGYFAIDRFVFAPRREAAKVAAVETSLAAKQAAERKAEQARETEKSIAVLPFANVGGKPDDEYFSDGLSEEMINTLGQLADLKVISRNSSFQYKGKLEDSRAIGKTLGVAYLLEGSVRKAGETVRIAVQLVRALDGTDAWSQSYDRDLKDIFAVQSEIATTVAQQLKATLANGGTPTALKPDMPPSGSVAAYNEYLQGLFYVLQGGEESILRGLTHYQRAVELDPDYALAYAALSQGQSQMALMASTAGTSRSKEFGAAARSSAARALQLAPNLPAVHVAQGELLESIDADPHAALREYRRAVALDPNFMGGLRRLAFMQATFGELEASLISLRRLAARDPLNVGVFNAIGLIELVLGHPAEAEAAFRKRSELAPKAGPNPDHLLEVALQGRTEEAVMLAKQLEDPFFRTWVLAMIHESAGQRDKSQPYVDAMIKKYADIGGVQIAQIYAARKQPEEMFRWLEHARKTKDPGMTQLQYTSFLVNYKSDPRFQALLREYRLLPEDAAEDNAVPATRN